VLARLPFRTGEAAVFAWLGVTMPHARRSGHLADACRRGVRSDSSSTSSTPTRCPTGPRQLRDLGATRDRRADHHRLDPRRSAPSSPRPAEADRAPRSRGGRPALLRRATDPCARGPPRIRMRRRPLTRGALRLAAWPPVVCRRA
jgi:hypothetical protein